MRGYSLLSIKMFIFGTQQQQITSVYGTTVLIHYISHQLIIYFIMYMVISKFKALCI